MEDKKQSNKDITQRILEGLENSYQKLVEFKRYKKSPLIVAKDGVIMEIAPENMLPTTIYKRNNESVAKKVKK